MLSPKTRKKIRVLVVDDSAIVRQVLSRELSNTDDIEVVGTAPDPYIARDKIIQLMPDVMTLDVEMPRMDGITFLRKIMKYNPIPTIVVSSLTPQGSDMALDALAAGAVDVLCKSGAAYSVGEVALVLADQIRAAARIDMSKMQSLSDQVRKQAPVLIKSLRKTTHKIIAIGASTGGTVAIEAVLRSMPANCPGIVMVQHMPESFTKAFAERLNALCAPEIREAKEGDRVLPGLVLLAPGNSHMRLARDGAVYCVKMDQGPRLHYQRPAVDCLFDSVADFAGANVVAALLTGMGKDGAAGLLHIREAGGRTIAQDEKSSVVWGMPGEAVRLGAAEFILPLDRVASQTLDLIESIS